MGLKVLLSMLLTAGVVAISSNEPKLFLIRVDFGINSSSSTYGCPDRLGFEGLISGPDNMAVSYRYVWLVKGRKFESKPIRVILIHGSAIVARTLTVDAAHSGTQAYGLSFINPNNDRVGGERIVRFRLRCFKGGDGFEEIPAPGYSPPPSPPMIYFSTEASPKPESPNPSATRQR